MAQSEGWSTAPKKTSSNTEYSAVEYVVSEFDMYNSNARNYLDANVYLDL